MITLPFLQALPNLFPGDVARLGFRQAALELPEVPLRDRYVAGAGSHGIPGIAEKLNPLFHGEAQDFGEEILLRHEPNLEGWRATCNGQRSERRYRRKNCA